MKLRSTGSILSTLFHTSIIDCPCLGPALMRSRTFKTSFFLRSLKGSAISRTCKIRSASFTSSRVALKAVIKSVGKSEMKPTVSDKIAVWPLGRSNIRCVVSSVANNISFATTSPSVTILNKEDLPALV